MIRIMTDSTADLWQEYVQKRNIYVITMNYRLGDNNYMATPDTASPLYMDDREFYRQMRAGVIAIAVRVGKEAGKLQLCAEAEGLVGDTLEITLGEDK